MPEHAPASPDGNLLHTVCGKPAAVVNKLARQAANWRPRPRIAPQVGAMLARMHLAGRDYPAQPAQPARPGLVERDGAGGAALPRPRPRPPCCAAELAFQNHVAGRLRLRGAAARPDPCRPVPRQRDVRRTGRLTGFFDFYFAGVDTWLFDIAVCLNDWCHRPADRRARRRARARRFLRGLRRGAAAGARPSGSCCRRCCAPARCASGSRGCGTSTCRARPACSSRTIPPTSSACCANASREPLAARAA